MTRPAILGIGTALPESRMNQMEICYGMDGTFGSRRSPALFRATQVESRHLVQGGLDWYRANPTNGERMMAYIEQAPRLGIRAIERALDQAHLTAQEIDALIVASSTGVDCPGVDVKVADGLQMSPFLRRSAIVGTGCHALLPSLYSAVNEVTARPDSKALVLAVELCTLHIQHNGNLRNILGSALFADGAGAAVVGQAQSGPFIVDTVVYSDYQTQEELSFHPGDTGYRIHLSGKIPDLLRVQAPPLVDRLLSANRLQHQDIAHWIIHPGGVAILDAIEEELDLGSGELDAARYVLRNCGNMSSATLLFVLDRVIHQTRPQPGEYGVMLGFGPGMTVEAVLLLW